MESIRLVHDVVNDVDVVIGAAANDATARAEVGKNTDDTDDDIECCAAATSDGMLRRASRWAMVMKCVGGALACRHE